MPLTILAGATMLLFVSYALRAARVQYYFGRTTSGQYPATLRVFLFHNLLNNLLPMHSGEISFPILMRREFDIPVAKSVAGLLYLRLLDLYAIVMLALVLTPWFEGDFRWLVLITLGAAPILAFHAQSQLRFAFEGRLGLLGRVLAQAISGFPSTVTRYVGVWLLTAANWVVKFFALSVVLRNFLPLRYFDALIGAISAELASLMPIHGIAGAGTYEGAVMVGLRLSGVELEAGITGAVNLHLFVFGASVIGGLLALLLPEGSDGTR